MNENLCAVHNICTKNLKKLETLLHQGVLTLYSTFKILKVNLRYESYRYCYLKISHSVEEYKI